MKVKGILRFYFTADSLERAFQNLIIKKACSPFSDGLETAERLISLIDDKSRLESLWSYLDGVMQSFTREERGTLFEYAVRRSGTAAERKAEKRSVIKFVRRARRLKDFENSIAILKNYYCLLKSG